MDLQKMLEERQKQRQELINRLQQLDVERQFLTSELLRLEGEIRLLNELIRKFSVSDEEVK